MYKDKYFDANFKHFKELLSRYENINISYSALYNILRKASILSPKVQKSTIKEEKKKIKTLLKQKKQLLDNQKDLVVKNNILDRYDAHSRIPRLKYFGECLEMDACHDFWFGNNIPKFLYMVLLIMRLELFVAYILINMRL